VGGGELGHARRVDARRAEQSLRGAQVHGAAVGLAIGFGTWQSLAGFGLTDEEAVGLMVSLVESTASI